MKRNPTGAVHVRLLDLYDRAQAQAKAEGRTLCNFIRYVLSLYLEAKENQK